MPSNYPWSQCISDQKKRYGSEETAAKVCGMIRAKFGGAKDLIINIDAGSEADIELPDGCDMDALLSEIEAQLQLSPIAQALQDVTSLLPIKDFSLSDALVAYGGAVKALDDNGWIEAPLVIFGSPERKDLTGEYFTAETNFGWNGSEPRPLLYHHGLDETIGNRYLAGKGWQFERLDDFGLWAKAQLDKADQYEAFLFKLAQAGKLGTSSGTAPHMIVKADDGRILQWFIAEGSLTPSPIDYASRGLVQPIKSLTHVQPLKALMTDSGAAIVPGTGAQPAPAQAAASRKVILPRRTKQSPSSGGITQSSIKSVGAKTMDKKQILDLIAKFAPKVSPEDADKIAELLAIALGLNAGAPDAAPAAADAGGADVMPPMKGFDAKALEEAVTNALKAFGIQPVQKTTKTDNVTRPPFTAKPKDDAADDDPKASLKALTRLKFGETDPGIKAIATDLYGPDYEQHRYEQHVAFGRFLRGGERMLDQQQFRALKAVILTPKQLKAAAIDGVSVSFLKADLSEVIDSLGGFTVPEDWRTDMLERLPGLTVVRRRADVSPTSSDVMSKIKLTGGDKQHQSAMRVTWVGDTPAANQAVTNPTFGVEKTPIHIAKLTVRVPMALLEDSAVNLSAKLGEWSQNEFAADEDEQFLVGNGIAKPQGVLPSGVNGLSLTHVASGNASSFPTDETQADCLMGLKYALPRQYRNNAIWVMNDTTVGVVSMLKDKNGQYLWHESLRAGEPSTLLGYPVETSEAMPDIAANAFPIIFGDFSGYQIADRIGMTLVRDETTEAEQDIVKFLFRRRLGGQVAREYCFAALEIAST
jgi:HK97 family phage major capsid protein